VGIFLELSSERELRQRLAMRNGGISMIKEEQEEEWNGWATR